MSHLKLGTRASMLALAQSRQTAARLEAAHPGLTIELIPITTTGDAVQDRPLHEFGGKGVFTKELEIALLDGRIDFAVHSLKDVPVTQPLVDVSALVLAAIPPRQDPRDVLVLSPRLAAEGVRKLSDLSPGSRVGTSSLRRACQLKLVCSEAHVLPLRGNIDTRLRKVRQGEYDAILLAAAGLIRGGIIDSADSPPAYQAGQDILALSVDEMLPAPAQAALALQCRSDDARTRRLLSVLDDPDTRAAVEQERELIGLLGGDCHSPIAAYARPVDSNSASRHASGDKTLVLHAMVFSSGGQGKHAANKPDYLTGTAATATDLYQAWQKSGRLSDLGYSGKMR